MPKSDRLKPLLQPKPIRVDADSRGTPVAVWGGRPERRTSVASIVDHWRIRDSWWRSEDGGEIHRDYWRIELQGGRMLDVFRDLIHGGWYTQPTSERVVKPSPVDVWAERRPDGSGSLRIGAKVSRA